MSSAATASPNVTSRAMCIPPPLQTHAYVALAVLIEWLHES